MFHVPDSLFRAGNFSLARVEYERIIFEDTASAIQAMAGMKVAECLKISGAYKEAAAALNSLNISSLPDSLRYRILFQSAFNEYLAHDAGDAFSTLEQIGYFFPDSSDRQDITLLKILSLNELRRWKEADTLYRQLIAALDKGFLPNPYLHIPKMKDPEKAERLSAYLPFTGAGLFYAGDIKEGILNVVLQLGFISFGAYSVLMERYITGILIGVGGYAAFYKGGARRAKRIAVEKNEKKTIAFNTKARNQLMKAIKKQDTRMK